LGRRSSTNSAKRSRSLNGVGEDIEVLGGKGHASQHHAGSKRTSS
jgi:hypothetical protein